MKTVSDQHPIARSVALYTLVVFLVAASVWLSHAIEFDEFNVTVIWPAGAFAVWLVLKMGYRAALPIFLGTELYHVVFLSPYEPLLILVSLFNTASAVVPVWLFKKVAGDNLLLPNVRNTLLVVCLVSVVQALTSAVPGMLVIGHLYIDSVHAFWLSFLRWVLSDMAGIIICLPVLMVLRTRIMSFRDLIELTVPGCITVLTLVAIWGLSQSLRHSELSQYPVLLLSMPLSIWLALSFRTIVAVSCLTILVVGTLAITLVSLPVINDQIILYVQAYASIIMSCALLLHALMKERQTAIARLKHQTLVLESEVTARTQDLALQVKETQLLADELKYQSNTDYLTGISNRRAFMSYVAGLRFDDSVRQPFLMLIDVDHFKNINDVYGHPVGDSSLIAIAKILESHAKDHEGFVARYGGEEFAALFYFTDIAQAIDEANQLRERIAEARVLPLAKNNFSITVSIGLVKVDNNLDQTLKRVDQCLYEAKRAGRNQVVAKEGSDAFIYHNMHSLKQG